MNVELLRTFVTVARTSSLSEASRRLDISKSTVSGRLAELEELLRRQLFYRSSRKVTLTQEGESVFGIAERILQEVDGLLAWNPSPGLRGKLRITAPNAFGRRHVSSALLAFVKANPEVAARVDLEDRVVDIVGEGYDLAIRVGQLADSSLIARRLADSRRLLVASTSYLQRHGTPRTPEELEAHEGVVYANRRGLEEWTFRRGHATVTARPKVRLRSNNPDFLHQATLDGIGLSIVPSFMVADDIASERLVILDVGATPVTEGIYAVYPSSVHVPDAVRAVIQHLAVAFGEPPSWDRQIAAKSQDTRSGMPLPDTSPVPQGQRLQG